MPGLKAKEDLRTLGLSAFTDREVFDLAMRAYGDKQIANDLCTRRRQMEYDKHKGAGG